MSILLPGRQTLPWFQPARLLSDPRRVFLHALQRKAPHVPFPPPPLSNRGNMAASSNAEHSPEISTPLKIPKTEVPSPESEDLSDSNQYHSNSSTPNRFSPLNVGSGTAGRTAASSSNSFTACRGMSWTPSETNALIAVWGNERLTEARMQQLEVAGTVFSGKAPGPAMYERVSRALSELGYERTPSQCRERMKVNKVGRTCSFILHHQDELQPPAAVRPSRCR